VAKAIRKQTMSVIDFIVVRRRKDSSKSEDMPSFMHEKSGKTQAPLTSSQFTSYVTHIIGDEMRRSLKRHVDAIGPR
jgi:hypothetical protein